MGKSLEETTRLIFTFKQQFVVLFADYYNYGLPSFKLLLRNEVTQELAGLQLPAPLDASPPRTFDVHMKANYGRYASRTYR